MHLVTCFGVVGFAAPLKVCRSSLPTPQGAFVVYVHSYFTVFHRAMHSALPPTSSWVWFLMYSIIFSSMTFLIKKERKGKGD